MKKQLTNEEKRALTPTEILLFEEYYLEKRDEEVLAKEVDAPVAWIPYALESIRRKIEMLDNQP